MSWQKILKKKKNKSSSRAKDPECYDKVKEKYTQDGGQWPSAYGSGALVQCRNVGAANWGKSVKKANPLKTWFGQRAKGEKGEPEVKGWVSCQSCEDDKAGAKPCGRTNASKGTKQRCREKCSDCKTYKRRQGNKRSRGRGFTR